MKPHKTEEINCAQKHLFISGISSAMRAVKNRQVGVWEGSGVHVLAQIAPET